MEQGPGDSDSLVAVLARHVDLPGDVEEARAYMLGGYGHPERVVVDPLITAVGWLERRYPRLWAALPQPPEGALPLALREGIVAGSWAVALAALQAAYASPSPPPAICAQVFPLSRALRRPGARDTAGHLLLAEAFENHVGPLAAATLDLPALVISASDYASIDEVRAAFEGVLPTFLALLVPPVGTSKRAHPPAGVQSRRDKRGAKTDVDRWMTLYCRWRDWENTHAARGEKARGQVAAFINAITHLPGDPALPWMIGQEPKEALKKLTKVRGLFGPAPGVGSLLQLAGYRDWGV